MEGKRLLIDHDILLYRALWGAQDEAYDEQITVCEGMIEEILQDLDSDDYTLVMSGAGNFRYAIYPEYKANRKDQPKPQYLQEAKIFFKDHWGAVLSEGCEADDVIGMAHDDTTIVVSSDKDFYQLGGLIYNPFRKDLVDIQNPWYFFYLQMLIGDTADNIKGILNPAKSHHKVPPDFTEKTAKELLAGKSKDEMGPLVKELYRAQYNGLKEFDINAQLLFLKRSFANEYHQVF